MPTDPAILRSIAAPAPHQHGAPPPAPGAGAAPAGDAAPAAEPVALHDASTAAHEAIKAARTAIEELQTQAELSDTIDPKVEKLIVKCSDAIGALDDDMDSVATDLGSAREEHDSLVTEGPPKG